MLKWQDHNNRCQITASGVKTFEDVQFLVAIAKSDFPELKNHEIHVGLYCGDTTDTRSLGIEFDVEEQHPDYRLSRYLLGNYNF